MATDTGFNIDFYWNKSSKEHVYKDIEACHAIIGGVDTPISHYPGTLRDESSIIDPIFRVQSLDDDNTFSWDIINYFYVKQWARYYYITDVIVVRKGLYEIHGHVDVLMSFKDDLENCPGLVLNQESDWNMYLDDGSCKAYQNDVIRVYRMTDHYFGNHQIILAVAGDGTIT